MSLFPKMAGAPRTFLFRFDGAPENDAFLEAARAQGYIVYSGIAMQVNHGWIPDFFEVVLDTERLTHVLTIVELEAKASTARVSARKYLPESSQELILSFCQYLSRVVERCRASADVRVEAIKGLHEALLNPSASVCVWAAGALREAPFFVERLPLIDQGALPIQRDDHTHLPMARPLSGEITASPREHKTLFRSILILDAVVRGWDKSDATLRAWRNLRSQPLKRHLAKAPERYPALCTLLLGNKTGAQIHIDAAAHEVSMIWSEFDPGRHSKDSVISALERFLPLDRTLDPNASVRIAFERAREVLRSPTSLDQM